MQETELTKDLGKDLDILFPEKIVNDIGMIIKIMICLTKYSNSIFSKMKRPMKKILFYIFSLLFHKESNRKRLYM